MFDLLRQLRDQRAMAVQNERQLMLVYLCCLEYITRKGSVDEHETRDGMDKSILMLCELVEQNKPKCTKYCPDEAGQEMTFQTADQGPITVRCEQDADFKFRKETKAKIRVRTLKVNGLGLEEPLTVRHYHWNHWPDRGAPPPDHSPMELLAKVSQSSTPIVVHCSAGIGRTGSIVMLQAIVEKISAGEKFEVEDLLKECRESRASLVQTPAQYYYIHEVLLNYYYARLGKYVASFEPSLAKYTVEYYKALDETTNNK
ncbi:unnamed protein product, partial [Mesorhabditis spiculigera]